MADRSSNDESAVLAVLSDEERVAIETARCSVIYRGKVLPVTTVMGLWGNVLGPDQYLNAFACVAYDRDLGWIAVECKPGELAPIHAARKEWRH